MADNVSVTPGAGTTIATDDVAGVHYQRVKLDGGGDGAAAPITSAALADATANPTLIGTGTFGHRWNGATWDRERANTDITVLSSAARTATGQSADQTNHNARGLHLVIDVTAVSGTSPTLVVTIQGKDALSGKYYTVLASASITAVGTTVLRVGPGLTAAANTVANDIMPRTWRIDYTIGGTTPSFTFSVGASLIA